MADDLGIECLSCYGSSAYQTPALDALAESGVRFTHCYSNPLCTPSRVQLMTGLYNHRNYREFGSLTPGSVTFAHFLKNGGYATCAAGKWQLAGHYDGSNYRGEGMLPVEAGFDTYCLWQVSQLGSRYWDPVIEENGHIRSDTNGKFGPDIFAEFINNYIWDHRKGPFFVYYPMVLTHSPFVPTPVSIQTKSVRHRSQSYFGDMVAYMDQIIGRIVRNLRRLGILQDTMIIFISDNGTDRRIRTQEGGNEIPGGKGLTNNRGTHVPLIIAWQDHLISGINTDLIDFSDFLPTMLEAASIFPVGMGAIDGQSFFPRMMSGEGDKREWIYCHYDPRWGKWKKTAYARDKEWKLYANGDLFYLDDDPEEKNPILPDSEHAAVARKKLQSVFEEMKLGPKKRPGDPEKQKENPLSEIFK